MKKLLLSLALASISITNAQKWNNEEIKGNGVTTKITRTTESYDEIAASGSFKYELVVGKEGTITISGDEKIIIHITTEVVGKTLKVGFEKNKNYSYHSEIVITIPFEEINAISFSGSGKITTKDSVKASDFELKLTGSGDGEISINSQKLVADINGSGDLKVIGSTVSLDAKLTGSGNLNCSNLEAQNAETSVTGSGNLKVNCVNNLIAKVAGSGNILYKSKPKTIDSKVAGSGNIKSY